MISESLLEGKTKHFNLRCSMSVPFGLGEWTDSGDEEVMEMERPTKKLKLSLCMHGIAGTL